MKVAEETRLLMNTHVENASVIFDVTMSCVC